MFQSSDIVKKLFYINVAMFIATLLAQFSGVNLYDYLALYNFSDPKYHTFQFITSMFMHGGFIHLLFNMIGLLSFGPDVENQLGERKFLLYYILMGLVAALAQSLLVTGAMVGASGAIFGLLVYFTLLNPDAKVAIIFFPFISFKSKYFTIVMVLLEFILAIKGGDHVGHWAHFGGAVMGFILYKLESKFNFNI